MFKIGRTDFLKKNNRVSTLSTFYLTVSGIMFKINILTFRY